VSHERSRIGEMQRLADLFRRALLRRERAAADEMARAYAVAWKRIEAKLKALLDELAAAEERGEDVSLAWLFQRERLQTLQRQVEAEWHRWAADNARRLEAEQRAAIRAAGQDAEALTRAALGPPPPGVTLTWARLPHEALESLVGFTSDGTPLRALLDALGAEASQAVRETLIAGLATGENPRAIARRVKGEFDGNLARALRVARTETLRAYRTAALRHYRANDDVVKGWIWLAAVQGRGAGRTCASCWAMHGTTHSLDEIMDDHPNGRCAAAPWVRSWAELGFEGLPEGPETPKGVDLFVRLTPQEQDRVLGQAGGAAYRAGAVSLDQFVGVRYSSRWGTLRYARSLGNVLGPEGAKRWEEDAFAPRD